MEILFFHDLDNIVIILKICETIMPRKILSHYRQLLHLTTKIFFFYNFSYLLYFNFLWLG